MEELKIKETVTTINKRTQEAFSNFKKFRKDLVKILKKNLKKVISNIDISCEETEDIIFKYNKEEIAILRISPIGDILNLKKEYPEGFEYSFKTTKSIKYLKHEEACIRFSEVTSKDLYKIIGTITMQLTSIDIYIKEGSELRDANE